jgi:hypothetical protein
MQQFILRMTLWYGPDKVDIELISDAWLPSCSPISSGSRKRSES